MVDRSITDDPSGRLLDTVQDRNLLSLDRCIVHKLYLFQQQHSCRRFWRICRQKVARFLANFLSESENLLRLMTSPVTWVYVDNRPAALALIIETYQIS